MASSPAQVHREECRREVRGYLAERTPLAFPAAAIRRKLRMDGFVFTDEEIEAAAAFLIELGWVREEHDELGSTKYFKATAAGILAHERAQ